MHGLSPCNAESSTYSKWVVNDCSTSGSRLSSPSKTTTSSEDGLVKGATYMHAWQIVGSTYNKHS